MDGCRCRVCQETVNAHFGEKALLHGGPAPHSTETVMQDMQTDEILLGCACREVLYTWRSDKYGPCAQWEAVLAAAAAGRLRVDNDPRYLARAVYKCSVSIVRRLVELSAATTGEVGDEPCYQLGDRSVLHIAVQCDDALEKCKLLPREDLGRVSAQYGTPVHVCLNELVEWCELGARWGAAHVQVAQKYFELFQWMVAQPECPLETMDVWHPLWAPKPAGKEPLVDCISRIVDAELAARAAASRRWSLPRAAWTGAVAGSWRQQTFLP